MKRRYAILGSVLVIGFGMADSQFFGAGPSLAERPAGDRARQAIASLRGYIYQVYASAVALIDLADHEVLHLEVAEDYSIATTDALQAIQVKDTAGSGSTTLATKSVRDAMDNYVDLVERNPTREVVLRYLSTAPIGLEQAAQCRVAGTSSLAYWRRAAAGADVAPLRAALGAVGVSPRVARFAEARNDDELRRDFLRRIHWDCGQPNLAGLREEFDASVIRYGATTAMFDANDGESVGAAVIELILDTITGAERQLTKADLARRVTDITRVSVAKRDLNALLRQLAQGFGMPGPQAPSPPTAPGHLLPLNSLPLPRHIVLRPALTPAVAELVRQHGLAFVTGGAGMGKTLLARLTAAHLGGSWHFADLSGADPVRSVSILGSLIAEIGASGTSGIILDGLNETGDNTVRTKLAQLRALLIRRDICCIATLHRQPSVRLFSELDVDTSAQQDVPDLSVDEVANLVDLAGGDGATWGRVSHLAGGFGHPQLVQAAIAGFKARDWPEAEHAALSTFHLHVADVEAERATIRARLLADLPDPERTLLYRLSLVAGRFNRAIAIEVGTVEPAVPMAGQRLDRLIGPWITDTGAMMRVSPLVGKAGEAVFSLAEQEAVHATIADAIINAESIDVQLADTAFIHGLLGRSEPALLAIANSILQEDQSTRQMLAAWFNGLVHHSTDRPIFPANPTLSRMLRLAQVLLCSEISSERNIRSAWQALTREMTDAAGRPDDNRFQIFAMSKLLINRSAAGIVDDWIDLILRLDTMMANDPRLADLRYNQRDEAGSTTPYTHTGFLFINQAMGLRGVDDLAATIDRLGTLPATDREKLLADVPTVPGDYTLIVNHTWLKEREKERPDWPAVAERYREMALAANGWGNRSLALRCSAARSIVIDESMGHAEAALEWLVEAEQLLGPDLVLSRAKAKIHYRQRNHEANLQLLRVVVPGTPTEEAVERAFMLREGAVSAASLGNWAEAAQWFEAAREAAAAARGEHMLPMEIGLSGDHAVALLKSGEVEKALSRMAEVVDALRQLDPEGSTAAAYCHRAIRHAVLWMRLEITGDDLGDDIPTVMVPGGCSNTEPPESIKELPLANIDTAFYLLAEAEIAADVDAELLSSLEQHLSRGRIPHLEVGLRRAMLEQAIRRSDLQSFLDRFSAWLDGMAFARSSSASGDEFDPLQPAYGLVPRADPTAAEEQRLAQQAVLAFGIVAAIAGELDTLRQMTIASAGILQPESTARDLVNAMAGTAPASNDQGGRIARLVNIIASNPRPDANRRFEASLRFIEPAHNSAFSRTLRPIVCKWICEGWLDVARRHKYSLNDWPNTQPMIEAAASSGTGMPAAAATILSALPAVNVRPESSFVQWLGELAFGPAADPSD
ncbi:hypothetical protein [Mesorhizobium sp.]|uniref:hypothetical protein n=1 Tax=Mesorhizobium sp. TaxID=1871066 RepID=UPI0011F45E53|nr:hypothetical protein [Mesorhizobium sp.]TIP18431.1 MAG: hypothetical protein E5X66_15735 [Mesorhizobium sp.]